MKKIFGVLLAAATLVLSAACASSGASGKPEPTDSGELSVMARPVEKPHSQESPAAGQDSLSTADTQATDGAPQ